MGYDIFLSWIKDSVSPPVESWNVDLFVENETSPKFNKPSCLCISIFNHHTYLLNSEHSYKTSTLPLTNPLPYVKTSEKKKRYPTFPPFLGPLIQIGIHPSFSPFQKAGLRVKWPLLLLPPHVHSSFAPPKQPVAERYPPSARRRPNKPRPPSFYAGPWGHIFRDQG